MQLVLALRGLAQAFCSHFLLGCCQSHDSTLCVCACVANALGPSSDGSGQHPRMLADKGYWLTPFMRCLQEDRGCELVGECWVLSRKSLLCGAARQGALAGCCSVQMSVSRRLRFITVSPHCINAFDPQQVSDPASLDKSMAMYCQNVPYS